VFPEGPEAPWAPLLRTREDDTAFAAFSEEDGLHVLHRGGGHWTRLGTVPDSGGDQAFDVAGHDLALAPDGQVMVAWTSRHTGALRAARWTGAAWERMGEPILAEGEAGPSEPRLAVSRDGAVWLAWSTAGTERSAIHAARWDGSRWVGELVYTRDSNGTSDLRARAPTLAPLSGGRVLLAWYNQGREAASVDWRQWTGSRWEEGPPLLSPPRGSEHLIEQQPGFPVLALGRDETAFIAWSQADSTRIRAVYVQRLTDSGWRWALHGLHEDPGQSDTSEVRLATGADGTLFVAWTELDWNMGERAWAIAARPCAEGERPQPFPPSRPLESFWPRTVETAAEYVLGNLNAESKANIRATPREDLILFHHGWGTGLRNELGLWRGNDALLKSCGGEASDPDACSMQIIERVWERLQK